MVQDRIEATEEFDFVKRFVSEYESSLPSSTPEILAYVGYGIGIFQGIIAQSFLKAIRKDITLEFRDKMIAYQLNAERFRDMNLESRQIHKTYTQFNPEVTQAYVEEVDNKALLMVLPRKNLSSEEIRKIISRSEKWRDFFFRVNKEYGENVGGGWGFEYPMAVEGLALRADPTLERDYKDTGKGLDLWYEEGQFIGLNVEGFKRAEQVRKREPILTLDNLDEELAKNLIGKRVDYHFSTAIRADFGLLLFGDLLRIL